MCVHLVFEREDPVAPRDATTTQTPFFGRRRRSSCVHIHTHAFVEWSGVE